VQTGLRSNDWRMPEEVNRVLTDRLGDLLLTPSRDALPNLLAERIPAERVGFVGNVMIDTPLHQLPAAREIDLPGRLGLERGKYIVSTLHRPSNVDDAETLEAVLSALAAVAERMRSCSHCTRGPARTRSGSRSTGCLTGSRSWSR
jgi:UDP-N-acetylglucosamine 2-epimerase (non-hydrolysing)